MKKVIVTLLLLALAGGAGFWIWHHRSAPATVAVTVPANLGPITFSDKLVLANVACNGQAKVDEKKTITCSVCPAGSDFAGGPGLPGSTGWTADSALAGHFTTKDSDEALLHASGCESHARNYGGDFILRRTAGQWSIVRYAPGATADENCQKLPWQQGRDALICETDDMHQGIASSAIQFLLFDAIAPASEDWQTTLFLETTDESANCGFEPGPGTIQIGKIDEVKILPAAANSLQNVAVQTTVTRVKTPKKPTESCPAGEPHTYRVLFHNKGDHFEAADGYNELAALKREDCCEMMLNQTVRPGKY